MRKYRAAIIGLGNIAWRYDEMASPREIDSRTHATTYLHDARTELAGGCSPDAKDRADFAGRYQVPVYSDPGQMLEEISPDIVSICSPAAYHCSQTLACLEAGVGMIWLEKPPATSLKDLDRLLDRQAALGDRTKVVVGYQRRYADTFKRLKKVLEEKVLGRTHLIQLNYSRGILENGSHYIDLLFFLLGDHLAPEISFVAPPSRGENPSFGLSVPEGPAILFSGIDVPYHCMDISVTCDLGRASILYGGLGTRWEERIEQGFFPGNFRLEETDRNPLGRGDFSGVMAAVLNDLIHAYEGEGESLSSLSTSRKTLVVLESLWQALDRKG